MSHFEVSETIKQQTDLALHYLEKASQLITYKKLVPVRNEQIDDYEKSEEKYFPPDYRYWLTNYGSGRIEFIEGVFDIPSIYELFADHGRCCDDDDPANCWKRIYLGYGGAPVTTALDSPIIDESGCCPVIVTKAYSNEVGEVLASSWPMYVIRNILLEAQALEKRISAEENSTGNIVWHDEDDPAQKELSGEMIKVVQELAAISFPSIDQNLSEASARAQKHNKTNNFSEGEPDPQSEMTRTILELMEKKEEEDIKDEGQFNVERNDEVDSLEKAMDVLEDHISKGFSCFISDQTFEAKKFLEERATLTDEPGLRELLKHPRREIREITQKGVGRLCPKEAEARAKRTYDWIHCAESWKELLKNDVEARRCLKEAEACAENSTNWRICSDFWKEHFQEKDEAMRCLKEAEACSLRFDDLLFCANGWRELNEDNEAKRCLKKAESKAEYIRDYRWCAESWHELGEDKEVIRCILEAKKRAESGFDWRDCGLQWENILDNSKERDRFWKIAEELDVQEES